MTYADVLKPTAKKHALLYDLSVIIGGSFVIALLAQLVVRLPFSPVPITGQTLGVLLIGSLLGKIRGTLAILTYLAEGMSGLPVFAGGTAGPAVLMGPTGGYLIGFIFAAYITGYLAEKGWTKSVGTSLLMMVAGTAIIFFFGLVWLAQLFPGTLIFSVGLLPFIPGAIVKILLATALLPVGWRWID